MHALHAAASRDRAGQMAGIRYSSEGQGQCSGTLDQRAAAMSLEHIAVDAPEAVGPKLDLEVELMPHLLSLVVAGLGRWQILCHPHNAPQTCNGFSFAGKCTQKRYIQRHNISVAASEFCSLHCRTSTPRKGTSSGTTSL